VQVSGFYIKMKVLKLNGNGLYCEAGDFYIDPWKPVNRAVITHAHSDHARWGMSSYLCCTPGYHVLKARMGYDAKIETLDYYQTSNINGVQLSFHPAGHILGSSQVRLEYKGEVWVVSGDYKVEQDPTCAAFEPVKCHTFITESTFGLPIYKWKPEVQVFAEINSWWKQNISDKRASIIFAYSLGKAQRLIRGVDPSIGTIYTHGAIEKMNEAYRRTGVDLPSTVFVSDMDRLTDWSNALVVAPPSANGTPWSRKFGDYSSAFASGWMAIRGARRRKAMDRGFVLSDHTDWPGLLQTIKDTGAQKIFVTHGYSNVVVRYLHELGYDAEVMETRFEGESLEESEVLLPNEAAE
jgi:putative mRNA 3-end processing factor